MITYRRGGIADAIDLLNGSLGGSTRVPDGFITIPRSGTLDYQGATFFDRNFHFNLPTDLTNVSKLLFTGYFSTYRVTVDADGVTNNAVCQSGVTTEIPINQAYIGGDTANISINVII